MDKIGEIGNFELRNAYDKLCENGMLKDENKIMTEKGLTCAPAFSKVFNVEWINIVWTRIYNMKLW